MKKNGFTVVELIITIVILAFGILGLYGFFYPSIVLTSNFPLHLTANNLAQEGIEIVKNIRDNNILALRQWADGFDICTAGCQLDYKTGTGSETNANHLKRYQNTFLNKNSDGFYSYDRGSATLFKRKITITKPSGLDDDILRIEVLITWNYRDRAFNSSFIGYIYNWL